MPCFGNDAYDPVHPVPHAVEPLVKVLRRVLGAMTIAAAVAGVLRVRGKGGTPPQHGGWLQLELPPEGR
jgi:hypothetical protein